MGSRGVGLGRVLGVPVRLDLSWFVGLGVVVALSRELWAPALWGAAALGWSLLFAVGFFACVLVHELARLDSPLATRSLSAVAASDRAAPTLREAARTALASRASDAGESAAPR